MASRTIVINGDDGDLDNLSDPQVEATLTELPDGSIEFVVKVVSDTGLTGDLNGLFFQFGDSDIVEDLQISGDDVIDSIIDPNNLNNLGNGNHLIGPATQAFGRFDVGVAFSEVGLSGDRGDVQEASFILSADRPLTLSDFNDMAFGARVTSVGKKGGDRDESLKLSVPCFAVGTLITTQDGPKPVEDIRAGDMVLTRDDGYQPVQWTGQRRLDSAYLARNEDFVSVRIVAGALGNNLPRRDLRVSPGHRMLISGLTAEMMFGERDVLVAASDLAGQPGISYDARPVTYVHIMFDRHQVIDSEGAWSESFQPADPTLRGLDEQQREELLTLFPELETRNGQRHYASVRRVLAPHEASSLISLWDAQRDNAA